MSAWSADEIWRRHKHAENRRTEIYGWIDEALAFAMPWRRTSGGRRDFDRLFDSSAPNGVMRFANRLQRDFTPPFQTWFQLKAGPMIQPELVDGLNRELDTATRIILAVLNASAFNKSSHEAYGDLSIGTAAMLFTEGDDFTPLRVTAAPPWHLGIEEGPDGTIWNVYFEKPYPAWQLPEMWPKAEWPSDVQERIDSADRKTDMIRVLQASYFDTEDRMWRLAVVVNGGDGLDGKGRAVAYESRRRSNPWVIPRWWTSPGNPWGFGPLLLALPDIRTANKTVEFVLRAAAYQLAPPLMVLHDGVVNPDRMRIAPSALIQVARTGGPMGRSIEPLDIGSRTDLGQIILQDQRQNIAKSLLDQGLPPDTGPVRSAAEIIGRQKELSYDAGAAFGRLNQEMVPGVIAAVIDILDLKKVPVIDWKKLQIDHLQLAVNVISPLARTQNLDEAQQIIQAAQTVVGLFGQEMLMHSAVVEDMPVEIMHLLGVRPQLIRTAQERRAIEQKAGAALAAASNPQAQQQDPNAPPGSPAPAAPFTTPQPGMMPV